MKQFLIHLLSDQSTRGLDIDSPATTIIRREIVKKKKFLHRIYKEWYALIKEDIPAITGIVLELGSGGGFISSEIPDIVTSEIFLCSHVNMVLDGTLLPFPKDSLKSIVMIDVLHHIPQPRSFFKEAARCINPNGTIVMIEPWLTKWSNFVYQKFHHEPFLPKVKDWEYISSGPLSGANGAIPWIIFNRDLEIFTREFPE